MENQTKKKISLVTLIVTALIAGFFNISSFMEMLKESIASNGNTVSAVAPSIGSTIGMILSWFNIALFVFIIVFYKYKKINLLWILLPYLGSVIFGLKSLLEKKSENEEEAIL